MTDIVEKLRDPSKGSPRWMDTMNEAADEIERLRELLKDVRMRLAGECAVIDAAFFGKKAV